MKKDMTEKILLSPEVQNNNFLLKKIGILDLIDTQKNEIKELNELLDDAVKIFSKQSIMDLINQAVKELLEKLKPLYLSFFIQDDMFSNKVNILTFKKMNKIDNLVTINSIQTFKDYFPRISKIIQYSDFQKKIKDKKLKNIFSPLTPKLIIPLFSQDEIYGFIIFSKKTNNLEYTKNEIDYINRIMRFVSIGLQNNINYNNAIIDSKTKLFLYSFFIDKLEREISRVKRYGAKFALLMIDIDHFKKINDQYGHVFGDKVLYMIAKILKESIRNADIASRFGGEEFIVLLVEADVNEAWHVAERIRENIAEKKLKYFNHNISITVSIGISNIQKSEYCESKKLIKMADTALYQSKENGRNQTTIYKKK
jgi:diguanylate cyclase (GGDEF)-like protein